MMNPVDFRESLPIARAKPFHQAAIGAGQEVHRYDHIATRGASGSRKFRLFAPLSTRFGKYGRVFSGQHYLVSNRHFDTLANFWKNMVTLRGDRGQDTILRADSESAPVGQDGILPYTGRVANPPQVLQPVGDERPAQWQG